MTDQAPAGAQAAALLARLSDEFFEVVHTTDPLNATQLGVPGFDALVPDPSRDGSARGRGAWARSKQPTALLDDADAADA